MKKIVQFSTIILLAGLMFSCNQQKQNKMEFEAPVAKIEAHEMTEHGNTRVDNYYWMKNRDSQDVLDYLNAENDYTKSIMQETDDFQEQLFEEMKSRIKQTDMSVPYKLNGYYYYTRYEEGKEYPIYCRKKENLDAEEEIMLDENEMAEGYAYYSIGSTSVSEDNKILAFSEDTVSRRKYTIKFKNLETGEIYPDEIPNTSGGMTWANDNKTVFFSIKDETLRSFQIVRHELGTPVENDVLVFQEDDATFRTFVYKTKSKKYLVVGSMSTLSSEFRILDAANPSGEFTIFQERQPDMLYSISHFDNKFYIRTNHEAKNFRLMMCPENATGIENWEEKIAHRDDVLLEGFEIFRNYLVISEKSNALDHIRIMPWDGSEEYYLPFEEEAYMAYLSANPEFDTDILRYGYMSMTTPNSTFDFNMTNKEKTLLKQQEVLGEFNKDDYETKRLWATAKDDVKVPITLVYKKSLLKKDGTNPLWITGYASYGSSSEPYFSTTRISLLDRGFVYAIAHARGGQEMGRRWYEDGKMLNKKNTFTDFIACTEFLHHEKYSSPEKTAAWGGSAGGLLMGAIANMRPDLYNSIIAAVPFVDVITTMLDESIPLTTGEYDEWGNPNEKEYYDYILSYSPYDQVKKQAYPNMLVTTGYHDSQVQYWEPAKWVAKLRAYKTENNMLLLQTNMDFGHGGASGRFEALKERALEFAFVMKAMGMEME
jgi:oligopeptidase B